MSGVKLTRSQWQQLEMLRNLRATTRARSVKLVGHCALSPQSLCSLERKGLTVRGACFVRGRGWLATYSLSEAGRLLLRAREAKDRRDSKIRGLRGRLQSVKRMCMGFAGDKARAIASLKAIGGVFAFSAGTHVYRLDGVAGSATVDEGAAVSAWLRAAERALKKLRKGR